MLIYILLQEQKMRTITTFSDMNKTQKTLWMCMRDIFNILDLYKYKKSTLDDLTTLSQNIDYIHRNRYLLLDEKFKDWKSYIANNLSILVNIFLHDISEEFNNSCIQAQNTRVTRSMAAVHMKNKLHYQNIVGDMIKKVNEIAENTIRKSERIATIAA